MMRLFKFSILAAMLVCAGVAFGQATNSGDISGTVTDSTGAVLPGVTVTVLDVDKNVTHTFVTNNAGVYDTGSIVPDHYLLTFTTEGFKTHKRGPITVSVGSIGLNVEMTIGGMTQQVVVTSEAPLLETSTSEISNSIPAETLAELPQVGAQPDWQGWIALQPGASGTPQAGQGQNNDAVNPQMQTAANGSLPYSTGLLDGVTISSPMSDNVVRTPIFEAIAEVKMSDTLFTAQYGLGGILYNQISKGGSDQYHGTGYEYFQNNAMNAAPYSFGKIATVPALHYSDIGGNIGGPIPIPRLKKRVFIFFDAEKIMNHGGANNSFMTVPNDAMRSGDFTGMNTIYDPTTQTVDASGVIHRQSFQSEYGNGNKIPAALIDPVAKNLQKYWPAPNTTATVVNGLPTNNVVYNFPPVKPENRWFGRFDADVNSSNRVTGSAAWNVSQSTSQNPACPANCWHTYLFETFNQISDVWTISPSVVSEFRLGFMGEYDTWVNFSNGLGIPAAAGLKFSKGNVMPGLSVTSESALAPGQNGYYHENVFDPSEVVTIVRGRHVLHIGGEFLIERADSTPGTSVLSANLGFNGVYTASKQGTSTTTGSAYADYLLGYASSWQALVSPEYGARLKFPQLFVQDDFKMNSNLTLNLGVRWVGTTGWNDIRGNVLSFDPAIANPATNVPGAMWYGSTHANGRTSLEKPLWNGFLPRGGFAYLFGQKTTIRGGYGIFTFPWSVDGYGSGFGTVNASTGNESDSTNGVAPVVQLSSDGNTNYQGAKGASINQVWHTGLTNPDAYNGQSVSYQKYDTPLVRLQQWNLTVQRQLSSNMMAQVGYVGSHAGNLAFVTDLNQVPEGQLGPNDSANRPYAAFQSITGNKPVAISNYHSLQVVVSKRMSSGLQFTSNYTYSKMLDEQDSSGWGGFGGRQPFQNAYLPSKNYGPSNFDIRHMVKGQAVYQLPIGKGRRFLNNNLILDEVVGGWQFSTTVVAQGGNPFTPTMASNTSYSLSSNGSQYPNVVGDPKLAGASGTVDQWFNVAAFASPGAGKFGNMHRNSVYGPRLTSVNASLHKSFPISEHVTFDIKAVSMNVINHPSFQQPDALIGSGHLGKITAVTVSGRSMQLIGKIRF